MRKQKMTSTTIVHFTIKRRPSSNAHRDQRGRVWFHRYAWLGVAFKRAPCFKRTLKFSFQE